MLNYEYPPLGGGAATACAHLIDELSRAHPQFSIDLVVSALGPGSIQQVSPTIKIHSIDISKRDKPHQQSLKDLLAYSRKARPYIRRLMKQNHYDLCHAIFGVPCGYLARETKLPYLVSLRGSDVPFHNKRFYWIDRLFLQRLSRKIWQDAYAVVANSDGLKQHAILTAPKQKISVIPNGVDTKKFYPNPQKVTPNPRLRILCVCRLIPLKRLDILIRAVASMPNSSAELTIAGDGPERQRLDKLISEHGVGNRVHLLGRIEHNDLPDLYRAHDVFSMLSTNEGMSNTVLEALATALPVVLSETGGTAELLEHNVNGLSLPVVTPETVASALNRYLSDPSLLSQHGNAGRLKAERMSWSATADRYATLYDLAGTATRVE